MGLPEAGLLLESNQARIESGQRERVACP
jgi:hypothetical protein